MIKYKNGFPILIALQRDDERNIKEEWVEQRIKNPDWKIIGKDNNLHLYKKIKEKEGKVLHLIINKEIVPKK